MLNWQSRHLPTAASQVAGAMPCGGPNPRKRAIVSGEVSGPAKWSAGMNFDPTQLLKAIIKAIPFLRGAGDLVGVVKPAELPHPPTANPKARYTITVEVNLDEYGSIAYDIISQEVTFESPFMKPTVGIGGDSK
jgi:hypothetical protein